MHVTHIGTDGKPRPARTMALARTAVAITPHDSTNFTAGACSGIYVGVTGDVTAIVGGAAILFKNAVQGSVLPIEATRVNSTATTATNLVALYE
jgi:hypothetical protein